MTAAASSEAELPSLAPCVAGLRTALADAGAAVERWCDEHLEPMARALTDAAAALARAKRMAAETCSAVPSHSRRARLVLRAVAQVEEAVRLIECARAWDWSDEDPEADAAMLADMQRALATAARAVNATGA